VNIALLGVWRGAAADTSDANPSGPSNPPGVQIGDSGLDPDIEARCVRTLTNYYKLPADDPNFNEAFGLCYAVESAPAPALPPPPQDEQSNLASGCFSEGSVVKVSQADIDEIAQWGRLQGRSQTDVQGDVEALNRSRGGSGTATCPKPASSIAATGSSTSSKDCVDPVWFGMSLDDAIAFDQQRAAETEAHLKQLEQEVKFWRTLELMPEWRWLAYVTDQIDAANNLGIFEPTPPAKMNKMIDRRYHKPVWGDTDRNGQYLTFPKAEKDWQASADGQAAAAEQAAYLQEYQQKMARRQEMRQLPRSPEDIVLFVEPAKKLQEIAEQQDLDIIALRRVQQDLSVWNQAKANGEKCAFATGPLGNPVVHAAAVAEPVNVYLLEGIGVVITTEKDATTRPACNWTGGGPRPCTAPAKIAQKFSGPFASVEAAKADLKTKLDCASGYWGSFAIIGGKNHWLQNNVGTGDCKTHKQL
jgi:hypothetical protein